MHSINPFWDFPLLRDEYFDNSLSGLTVSEDDGHIYVEAHVPGKIDTKSDIQATCKDGLLKIIFNKLKSKPSAKKIPVKGE